MQNIEISKIHPHYNNPRKELGDLTELAESIKSNGIFQNLTVVPWFSEITGVGADDPKQQEKMGYIVVIGHRRLAAAKLAGLKEVPCVVSNMDLREQVATMLLENMQRSDLTVWEQAQGFQMMLDLGETIEKITEKTGFSVSTVRRRMKLLELDGEKFKKSVERGATLMDFVELEKIRDLDLRNKVLEKIGTPNFKWELQNALDKEKGEANAALIIAELEKFAKKVDDTNNLMYVKGFGTLQESTVTIPEDAGTAEYFYRVSGTYITLYKKYVRCEDNKANLEREEKEQERKATRTALDEISKRAYQLRRDFILNISNAKAKKNLGIIIEYSLRNKLGDTANYFDIDDLVEAFGIEVNTDDDITFDDIKDHVKAQLERWMLVATYFDLDAERETYYNWENKYVENEELDMVYDFLEKLGYETSDEEKKLREGTHELLQKAAEEIE